jgi:hypothetical protein
MKTDNATYFLLLAIFVMEVVIAIYLLKILERIGG